MPWDVIIGRGIAYSLHPLAAWRRCSHAGRAFVVCAYAGVGFTATLTVLLLN